MQYWEDRYKHHSEHHSNQNASISIDFLKAIESHPFFLSALKCESLIEIGCGTGELCYNLKKIFNIDRILGVDISEEAVSRSRSKFQGIEFQVCNILDENINESFDVAVTSNTLEHFKDPFKMIDEMKRIAKNSIIIVPLGQPVTDPYEEEGGAGHVFMFTEDSFQNVIDKFLFTTSGWQHRYSPYQLAVLL